MARLMQALRKYSRMNSKTHSKLNSLMPERIELRVPMCCDFCEENVRQELTVLDGVKEISIDMGTQKVVVLSHYDEKLEAYDVLNAVKKVKHRAELWTR